MRIIFQGDMTPAQLGKAVKEIIETTLGKMEDTKPKRKMLHNPVVEVNLNLQGVDEPQLLIDEDKGQVMYQVRTGYKDGEFVEYVEVDRQELVDKFNRMVADVTGEEEKDPEVH